MQLFYEKEEVLFCNFNFRESAVKKNSNSMEFGHIDETFNIFKEKKGKK